MATQQHPLDFTPEERCEGFKQATSVTDFKTIATAMAQRGICVCPTYPGLRFPALQDWQHIATTDLAQIERWHQENPDYNCVSVAKNDGVFMLDIDNLEAAQKRGMPQLPPTFTVNEGWDCPVCRRPRPAVAPPTKKQDKS